MFYLQINRLELNEKEQQNAIKKHTEVRDYIESNFKIERSFLTGSYKRHTKTKPLKDIDIFFVIKQSEKHYLDKHPSVVLDDFYKSLVEKYGESAVRKQDRSINVDFGVVIGEDDKTDYRVLSVDVVPSFDNGSEYEIPDSHSGTWIKTDPEIHAEKATLAHQNYSNEWKGLVRMVKYWNNNPKHGEKPVKPSFLLEVMALECLYGVWGGSFDREIQAFFATLANRIHDDWPDPAGLGPCISNSMDESKKQRAKQLLETASKQASLAINHSRNGQNGEALKVWRDLFGKMFPLS